MGVSALEHVTIRCTRRQATRDFYVDLLGLTEGPRPDFPFRGHWLYLGGVPVVHLVEAADHAGAWARAVPEDDTAGTGAFDHVAFRGEDFEALRTRLQQAGLTFRERVVPGGKLRQLFVPDPEGITVEINFHA